MQNRENSSIILCRGILCGISYVVEVIKMKNEMATIFVGTQAGVDISNLSPALQKMIDVRKIRNGVLHATAIGSTGSITTIEFEPGLIEDMKRAIRKLAPPEDDYKHDAAWGDGNGHSHVQAALIGPSVSLPIRDGKLALGTWQQVVAINHDNRPRDREIQVTMIGE